MENIEQLEAINSREKCILVLAGAGSGKTKTLIDKIKFYINELKISPKNMVAITFTRDAVHEIQDRLIEYTDKEGGYKKALKEGKPSEVRKQYMQKNNVLKSITIRTFHSLCYAILKESGAPHYDNRFKLLLDKAESFRVDESLDIPHAKETIETVLRKAIKAACEESPDFLLKLEQYLMESYYTKQAKVLGNDKSYDNKQYKCINGVIVKSKSEQRIVDWFHFKGYEVEYEPLEVTSSFKFKPDFKLSEKEFYIEHKSDLSSDLNDKLKALKKAGKPCFVTREEWMQDSEKIEIELRNILSHVVDGSYSARFSKEFDNRFKLLDSELMSFIKDVKRVYDLIKSQHLKLNDIQNIESPLFSHKRIKTFYELFPVVCRCYEMLKRKNSLIDFNDMLSLTLDIMEKDEQVRNYYRDKFRCILIDEFQDVNNAQVELVKHLFTEKSHLFCVGDDWQSIYGFRGSDIKFIVNFKDHFPDAEIIKLKYNFRSTESIVKVGNEIIANNANQIEKEVVSFKKDDRKVILWKANSDDEIIPFIREKLEYHLKQDRFTAKDIMVLGRRTDHISTIKDALENTGIRITTIHKSKGLEARVVFIAGLKGGSGGFPDTWLSDSIYQVVKETNMDILMEEERRLFYVAITRAKEHLYLLTANGLESKFIDELPVEFIDDIVADF